RLVDQCGGLKRLPRMLLGQLLRRQLAQLVVDQRQELAGGAGIALLDGGEDARDFGHRRLLAEQDARSDRESATAEPLRKRVASPSMVLTARWPSIEGCNRYGTTFRHTPCAARLGRRRRSAAAAPPGVASPTRSR